MPKQKTFMTTQNTIHKVASACFGSALSQQQQQLPQFLNKTHIQSHIYPPPIWEKHSQNIQKCQLHVIVILLLLAEEITL